MNRISKHLLTVVVAIVAIAGCIYAGRTEYNDDVLSGMSAEKYTYTTAWVVVPLKKM